jgi:hypothetical protein
MPRKNVATARKNGAARSSIPQDTKKLAALVRSLQEEVKELRSALRAGEARSSRGVSPEVEALQNQVAAIIGGTQVVGCAKTAEQAESAKRADAADLADRATSAGTADNATSATKAEYASNAGTAEYSKTAGSAASAKTADTAGRAEWAEKAVCLKARDDNHFLRCYRVDEANRDVFGLWHVSGAWYEGLIRVSYAANAGAAETAGRAVSAGSADSAARAGEAEWANKARMLQARNDGHFMRFYGVDSINRDTFGLWRVDDVWFEELIRVSAAYDCGEPFPKPPNE